MGHLGDSTEVTPIGSGRPVQPAIDRLGPARNRSGIRRFGPEIGMRVGP